MTINISGRSQGGTTVTTRLLKAIMEMPPTSSVILVHVSEGAKQAIVMNHVIEGITLINDAMQHTSGRTPFPRYRIQFV